MSVFKRLVALVAALLASSAASANLSANPIIVEFMEGAGDRNDITVSNDGPRVQYLEITALRIEKPGASPESLIGDPDPAKVGLLVAPRRLSLKPGEEKKIRLIKLATATTHDLAWRVEIKPVAGEVESRTTGAVVQIGYKALVFARPANPSPRLDARRTGTELEITNTGNTNALLADGVQCPAVDQCSSVTGKRLWPGDVWKVTLPVSAPVRFKFFGPTGESSVEY
jgi:Mat/Ecp fimbriae periplasmic chaperone